MSVAFDIYTKETNLYNNIYQFFIIDYAMFLSESWLNKRHLIENNSSMSSIVSPCMNLEVWQL